MLYELLVRDGLEAVQYNEDQVAGPGCADDLLISAQTTSCRVFTQYIPLR